MISILHPAPGLGDIMPGQFVVPQNPLLRQVSPVVRGVSIGEILPAMWSVPENPLLRARQAMTSGLSGSSCGAYQQAASDCGCGCSGAGTCKGNQSGQYGMGDLSDYIPAIPQTVAGIPVTYLAAGALLLFFAMSRGTSYRDEARELRSEYRYKLSKLKRESPRRYDRVSRTIQEQLA